MCLLGGLRQPTSTRLLRTMAITIMTPTSLVTIITDDFRSLIAALLLLKIGRGAIGASS